MVATYWRAVGKLFRQGRPKSGLIPLIEGIDFQNDGSAKHLFNEDDRVVDLHIHRAEVKRWVKRTSAERRKVMQKQWSHG